MASALLCATVMIAHQVAGKATRDAIFLSTFDVSVLPKVVMGGAVLSFAGVIGMSALLARLGPVPLVAAAFGLSSMLFGVEWYAYAQVPRIAATLLYLQMAIFGAILISGFWSVINERFDPHTAKSTVARIGAAATLGGVLGGLMSERVAELLDVRAMLLVLAGMHLICALAVLGVGRPRRGARSEIDAESPSGLDVLIRTPYLQHMALLVALAAVGASMLDYALKSQASMRFDSSEQLIAFFGRFYAIVGVLTFAVQTMLGPRTLQRMGLAGTLALLPGTVLSGGMIGMAITHLSTVVVLRGAESAVANSLFRSAFELLYTPLTPDKKRPTKTIIDVAASRLGDVLGSGILLTILYFVARPPVSAIITLAMIAACAALFIVGRLHRGYVAQLADSLKAGALTLVEEDVVDATTRGTLAEASHAREREILRARIEELRIQSTAAASPHSPDERGHPLLQAIADLTSAEASRIRRVLRDRYTDPALLPYLIPLVAHPEMGSEAELELRWLVPRAAGQITDALLDPDTPIAVRERLPSVLEVYHNPRAVEGLLHALGDGEFTVRYECALVLGRMLARSPDLQVSRSIVFDAVRRELEAEAGQLLTSPGERAEHYVLDGDGTPLYGIHRGLHYVFTLLGLVLNREALRLALQAFAAEDVNQRGTALEYLENVLPDEILAALWPRIGAKASGRVGESGPARSG